MIKNNIEAPQNESADQLFANVNAVEKNMLSWDFKAEDDRERHFHQKRRAAGLVLFDDAEIARLMNDADGKNAEDLYHEYKQKSVIEKNPIKLARHLELSLQRSAKFEFDSNPAGILAVCIPVLETIKKMGNENPLISIREILALIKIGHVYATHEHSFAKLEKNAKGLISKISSLDGEFFDKTFFSPHACQQLVVAQSRIDGMEVSAATLAEYETSDGYSLLQKQLTQIELLVRIITEKENHSLLNDAKEKIKKILDGFDNQGEFTDFFREIKNSYDSANVYKQYHRLQKELLLILAAARDQEEYQKQKTRFSAEWTTSLGVDHLDHRIYTSELRQAEARHFYDHEPDKAVGTYREAADAFGALDLDFHRAEALLEMLEKHLDRMPDAKKIFHEVWSVFEHRFERHLVIEWHKGGKPPALFTKLMSVSERIYQPAASSLIAAWQKATREHDKYLERKIYGETSRKIDTITDGASQALLAKISSALSAQILKTRWKKTGKLNFADPDFPDTDIQITLSPDEIGQLKKNGRLHKDYFFTTEKEDRVIGHGFFYLSGRDLFLLHRGKHLIPFSSTEASIVSTSLDAMKNSQQLSQDALRELPSRSIEVKELYLKPGDARFDEVLEQGALRYFGDLGFLAIAKGSELPAAINASNGELIGGAAIERFSAQYPSFTEIFLYQGGADGHKVLLEALSARSIKPETTAEIGRFFISPIFRGDPLAEAYIFKSIANHGKNNKFEYGFMTYHRAIEHIFQRMGVEIDRIKSNLLFNDEIYAVLCKIGLEEETIEAIANHYFGRRALNPIHSGIVNTNFMLKAAEKKIAELSKIG